MRKKRLGILILAVLIALGTGITANSIVSSKFSDAKVTVPAVIKPAPTIEILVARHEIQIGRQLKFDDFAWRKWPEELVSPDYFTWEENANIGKKFEGYVARMPMAAGEPIIPGKMVDPKNRGGLSIMLRKGMRAISVAVAPETGAAGFIMPGDYVDLIVTLSWKPEEGGMDTAKLLNTEIKKEKITKNKDGKSEKSDPSDLYYTKMNAEKDLISMTREKLSETILRNVRVLAIDQAISQTSVSGEGNPEGAPARLAGTVTLEVTGEQAEIVSLARDSGTVSLALRSYADNVPEGDDRLADVIPEVSGTIGVSKEKLQENIGNINAVNLLRGSTFNSAVITIPNMKNKKEKEAQEEQNKNAETSAKNQETPQ